MTQRDDHLQNTEAFIAGKQDTLHMYSGLCDGHMEVTGYYILPGIYLVYNDIHTQIVANDNQGLSKDILLINYCEKGRCEFKTFDDHCHYIEGGMIMRLPRWCRILFIIRPPFIRAMKFISCALLLQSRPIRFWVILKYHRMFYWKDTIRVLPVLFRKSC